jgi:hypothetical protein
MNHHGRFCAIVFCAALASFAATKATQAADLVSSATTAITLKQLFSSLDSLINKARDDGDYLLARAGAQAKDALDTWQKANGALLDKAFSELDAASRENFARANQLINSANSGVANRLETAQQITENANQIVESIPLSGNQTYILRFQPRILPPNATDNFTLRLRGVNLDKGNPKLKLSNGEASRSLVGPLEVQYTIPISEIPRNPSKIEVRTFDVSYTTPSDSWIQRVFGKRNEVKREVPVISLPTTLASYELTGVRRFENREERTFYRYVGEFRGRNTTIRRVAIPINSEPGWKWDLEKPFDIIQGHGEAGRCHDAPLMNESSENGVTISARVDEIRNIEYPLGTDGYVNCTLCGTVYRIVSATENISATGEVSWNGDKTIPLPPGTESFVLKVKSFDNRERVYTSTGSDKFYNIRRDQNAIIISPVVPEDMLN